MEERLQKILARAGYGSRRSCEEIILSGRVRVNGQPAQIGQKADLEKDGITVDGKLIAAPEALVYIALNKPRNVLSTVTSPDPRPTVLDLVNVPASVYPVGRLDFESEGLILLTNDGDLANRLSHPRFGHQKEYRVLVARQPDAEQLEAFRHGVVLEDGYRTAPAEVRVETTFGKGAWMNVILREGRKRQIRETCAQIGLPVVRILRVRIGSLHLGTLKPREWRYLTPAEILALKSPNSQKKMLEKRVHSSVRDATKTDRVAPGRYKRSDRAEAGEAKKSDRNAPGKYKRNDRTSAGEAKKTNRSAPGASKRGERSLPWPLRKSERDKKS